MDTHDTHDTHDPKGQETPQTDRQDRSESSPGSTVDGGGVTAFKRPSEPATQKTQRVRANNVRKLRTERMMSKAELARRAGLSTLTIDRVEKGFPCRMDTKRKILEALGLTPSDRVAVFGEED